MFSLKHGAEISLVFLIPLWQPSLKYNQLFRVIVAKELRISNMAAWGCVTSPESLFQTTQIQCDMWFDTDPEKTYTAISAALLTGAVLFCAKGADYQHTKLHLSVWQAHMESDSLTHNLCGSAAPCG